MLEPEPLPDGQEITEETLDQAVDIIRNRVDGLGVREPEVTRQGETILVQNPGGLLCLDTPYPLPPNPPQPPFLIFFLNKQTE